MSHLAGFVHSRPCCYCRCRPNRSVHRRRNAHRSVPGSEVLLSDNPKIRSLDRIDEGFGGSEHIMIAFHLKEYSLLRASGIVGAF